MAEWCELCTLFACVSVFWNFWKGHVEVIAVESGKKIWIEIREDLVVYGTFYAFVLVPELKDVLMSRYKTFCTHHRIGWCHSFGTTQSVAFVKRCYQDFKSIVTGEFCIPFLQHSSIMKGKDVLAWRTRFVDCFWLGTGPAWSQPFVRGHSLTTCAWNQCFAFI